MTSSIVTYERIAKGQVFEFLGESPTMFVDRGGERTYPSISKIEGLNAIVVNEDIGIGLKVIINKPQPPLSKVGLLVPSAKDEGYGRSSFILSLLKLSNGVWGTSSDGDSSGYSVSVGEIVLSASKSTPDGFVSIARKVSSNKFPDLARMYGDDGGLISLPHLKTKHGYPMYLGLGSNVGVDGQENAAAKIISLFSYIGMFVAPRTYFQSTERPSYELWDGASSEYKDLFNANNTTVETLYRTTISWDLPTSISGSYSIKANRVTVMDYAWKYFGNASSTDARNIPNQLGGTILRPIIKYRESDSASQSSYNNRYVSHTGVGYYPHQVELLEIKRLESTKLYIESKIGDETYRFLLPREVENVHVDGIAIKPIDSDSSVTHACFATYYRNKGVATKVAVYGNVSTSTPENTSSIIGDPIGKYTLTGSSAISIPTSGSVTIYIESLNEVKFLMVASRNYTDAILYTSGGEAENNIFLWTKIGGGISLHCDDVSGIGGFVGLIF